MLGLHRSVALDDILLALDLFSNLKEINFTTVRINMLDESGSTSGYYTPGTEDRYLEDCIVQDCNPSQLHRPDNTMREW